MLRCAVLSFSGLLLATAPAKADFKVWTPDVENGEVSIENVGDVGVDKNSDKTGEQSFTAEVEYGVTSWWVTELEFEFERDPGSGQVLRFDQLTSENLFQFSERGENWIDTGFFAEFGYGTLHGTGNETTLGPVLRKDFWGLSNTVNLFIEKDIGVHAAGRPQFLYAWETRIDSAVVTIGRHVAFEPGFQFYGQPGQITNFSHWSRQDNRAGPQLFGKIFDIGPGTLEWNGGFLIGLTAAVPAITPRWQLEYEIHF